MTRADNARPSGDPVEADTITTFKSFNPASGALVGKFPVHTTEDVAHAVLVARGAAQAWWDLGFDGRARALNRWRRHIAIHQDELATLVQSENGKPRNDVTAETFLSLEHMRWASRNAASVLGPQKVSSGVLMFNHSAVIEHRPYGVVGVIGPWNYPIYTPLGSVTYALAAGNAVVFKPSEFTPATGAWLVEAFAEANPDVPRGVLSLITGFGETGAALCRSGVDKIAFTGSTATGKKIMAACADSLTPVTMECGGKDVMIVADDADVAAAAQAAAWGGLVNSGQTCLSVELVYVTEPVREKFLKELRKQVALASPGSDGKAAYGPMTMPSQIDVVRRHVTEALARGAKAIIGGTESIGDRFIAPIVLVDAPDDCAAVREETFGPTIVVRTVADIEEAIRLVNASEYALGSSVFSRRQGMAIARRLKTGMTSVNAVLTVGLIAELPLGGNGASGFGRLHGSYGLREFATTKSITERRFTLPIGELTAFDVSPIATALVRRLVRVRHGLMGR